MKKSVLFVDDEPLILQGLRRMLRAMRGEWDMKFARSGRQALEIMAQERFDVVVSDMRMPEMDGAQLLSEVKRRYPDTVRIILSGQSDKEATMKTVRHAHQYLFKPCQAAALKSTINRACALRDLLAQDSLKRLVSRMESLPSLPSIYTELVDLLQSPDCSIQTVGEVIARDLGMTAKILQLVNSAFFGIPRHISSPAQAVGLLGLDTVRALVLTVGIFSKFEKEGVPLFGIDALWNHSIRTGAICKAVALKQKMDRQMVDDTFMAGLLHDVGKLVLIANIPENYGALLREAREQETSVYEKEVQALGTSHAEVGAYLLGLWGIPDTIVEAVAFHHAPKNCLAEGPVPLTIVHVANGLEHDGNRSLPMENAVSRIDFSYLERLGLIGRIHEWQEICNDIKEGVRPDD